MARIHIKRQHDLDHESVRSEIEGLAKRLADELSASYSWKGDRLEFKRSGASGHLEIDGQQIEVDIKLGVLLTPLKSTIESKINSYLDRALG